MSEMPERKVLRTLLTKLKKKTITSKNRFEYSVEDVSKRLEDVIKVFKSDLDKLEKKRETIDVGKTCKDIGRLLSLIRNRVAGLVGDCYAVLEDLDLYIESLETYSTELDKTLWDAIEQAKKEVEEKIKQQKELTKRKSPESYTV